MQDALVVCNLNVFILLVLIVERNVNHIVINIEEYVFGELERFGVVVNVNIVVHLVRVEIVAIDICVLYIESQCNGGRRIVVALNG